MLHYDICYKFICNNMYIYIYLMYSKTLSHLTAEEISDREVVVSDVICGSGFIHLQKVANIACLKL